jgi:voltage-gated potassium channel
MPSSAIYRLRLAIVLIIALILTGVAGYYWLEGIPPVDGLYMTIITLSTVGFGEVVPLSSAGRMFTIALIVTGVGVGAWTIESAVEVLLGDQFWYSVGRRRMEREIRGLQGHFIVCGYGRMGQQTVAEFQRRGVPFVVVESSPEIVQELIEQDVNVVEGDATLDETLLLAGIERARGLIAAVDTDADNVLTVLSAKELNPGGFVVARAALEESESKLYRAGADRVVTPYTIGGRRIALAVLRPTVTEFLNMVVYSEEQHTEMAELPVGPESHLADKTIRETELRSRWGATVIGVKKTSGEMIISPTADHRIQVGDIVLVVVESAKLRELEAL